MVLTVNLICWKYYCKIISIPHVNSTIFVYLIFSFSLFSVLVAEYLIVVKQDMNFFILWDAESQSSENRYKS